MCFLRIRKEVVQTSNYDESYFWRYFELKSEQTLGYRKKEQRDYLSDLVWVHEDCPRSNRECIMDYCT